MAYRAGTIRRLRCGSGNGGLRRSVNARERFLQRLRLVRNLKLQERRLLDYVLGTLRVIDAGKLDDDAIVPGFLDERLRDAELIDSRSNDLESAIERLDLVGNPALRFVDLQREMHSALQIEPAFEGHTLHGVVNKAIRPPHALHDLTRI